MRKGISSANWREIVNPVGQQGVVLDLDIPPLNRELRDLHGDLPWLIYERDNTLDWLADRDI